MDTFNITLGNANQNLHGPSNPTDGAQIITAQGNWKFTLNNAKAGQKLGPLPLVNVHFPLPNNETSPKNISINQEQHGGGKDSVRFRFCNKDGTGTFGTSATDQGRAIYTRPVMANTFLEIEILKDGSYTFPYGAG